MNDFEDVTLQEDRPGRTGLGDRGFVPDAERAFLYRALAVQARSGASVAEAATRIAAIFSDREGEQVQVERRRRAIRIGATRFAKAMVEAEERGGARMLCDILESHGLALSDEETAAFAIPFDSVAKSRLPDLLTGAADFLRDAGRP